MACGCQKNKTRPRTATAAPVEELLEVMDADNRVKFRTRSRVEANRRASKIAGGWVRPAGRS